MADGGHPAVFTIPSHRSFADALASGLLQKYAHDPLALARGRILLPTNRAIRTVTEAFVRISGNGLLLPRLVAIGDPDLDDRIGGALDPLDLDVDLPPAMEPLERQLLLASLVQSGTDGAAEAMRLARDLARVIDSLHVEEVSPDQLKEMAASVPELAGHWQAAYSRLDAVLQLWPSILSEQGKIDLSDRRNRLLRGMARRWAERPPEGFVVAAGITTAAPAIAALQAQVARLDRGMVILPGLALADSMPDEEWEALGPDENGRGQVTHPQYHLKLLLDRMAVARAEVGTWRASGRGASPAVRARAVTHAMTGADFSDKWNRLPPAQRRLSGVRCAELPDPASEAQAIAIALREALETPGQTAALVTPDRLLAARVSAHLQRWKVEADDSAGQSLASTPAGTLLLALVSAHVEKLAPVPLLALLKHPLVGGQGDDRLGWLDQVRRIDRGLRGPRPPAGLDGLDQRLEAQSRSREAWQAIRPRLDRLIAIFAPVTDLASLGEALRHSTGLMAGDAAWRGPDGRAAAELVGELEQSRDTSTLKLGGDDALPLIRQLLDKRAIRRPFGGHPRIAIYGLLEARLQQADLVVLGGLNEGVWPALASPDPWLAPALRRQLGLPGLESRVGLAAHDFASALGAPRVLLTRARRDSRSPTVASRLWLRLQAMTGGLPRDLRLERLTPAVDRPDGFFPVERPAPNPPLEARPKRIAVTDLDRLNADPFAFYAKAILGLRSLDPVDADHTAAWKGTAVHDVFEKWFTEDHCAPEKLKLRARALLDGDDIHPMLRALWAPRLLEAIDWIAAEMASDRAKGRVPILAEKSGEAEIAGVKLFGRVDRIDRLPDGRLAIVDYKTGQAPSAKAVAEGFALQLGLLALIAQEGGFGQISGESGAHEYWSLAKKDRVLGYRADADKEMGSDDFVAHAAARFTEAAHRWLTGHEPFIARLNPAYAPYGDFDQVMRLEEWYGRD